MKNDKNKTPEKGKPSTRGKQKPHHALSAEKDPKRKKPKLSKSWKKPPPLIQPAKKEAAKKKPAPKIPELDSGSLDAFFDPASNVYYRRDEEGKYIKAQSGSIGRYLKSLGYSAFTAEGETMSAKDRALEYIERFRNVCYAGPLAGHSLGMKEIKGDKILVTESLRLIDPAPGEWENLRAVFEGLLDVEQSRVFFAWLKVAIEALRAERHRCGQALVIAGPPSCGKSLVQDIITALLGEREAKPFSYMTGKTPFNSELFEACHLVIGDEQTSADPRERKKFAADIKQVTVERSQRCHPKNRPAFMLSPIWRLSITLNADPAGLQVLPQLEEGVRDKIILLKAEAFPLPVDTTPADGEEKLWNLLSDEMPAFVDYLLNVFTIPESMSDPRFGVKAYHNPDILEMCDSTSDEYRLLELIDTSDLFASPLAVEWEGKAVELEERLVDHHGRMAAKLFSYNSAGGKLLGMLKMKTDRVTSRKLHGHTLWKITPAQKVDFEESAGDPGKP